MNETNKPLANGRLARRRSLLELAPLELDCMSALWLLGEGTVREIHDALAPRVPRAYTTIMTIMDRLTTKGIVQRERAGRAWRYRANLSQKDAGAHAVAQVVEKFFGGSREALLAQMSSGAPQQNSARGESRSGAGGPAESGNRARIDETSL